MTGCLCRSVLSVSAGASVLVVVGGAEESMVVQPGQSPRATLSDALFVSLLLACSPLHLCSGGLFEETVACSLLLPCPSPHTRLSCPQVRSLWCWKSERVSSGRPLTPAHLLYRSVPSLAPSLPDHPPSLPSSSHSQCSLYDGLGSGFEDAGRAPFLFWFPFSPPGHIFSSFHLHISSLCQ